MLRIPLPPELVEQAREYADGTRTPAEPRDAATVVLLRPSEQGPKVYLLRRQTSMAFAGGMCVFPGGAVDPRDFDAAVAWHGPSPETVIADTTGEDWEADRVALEGRELAMTELLARRGLVLRSDLLGVWSGWLTPVFEPRRYRTWFFVAEMPEGQRTRDVSTESSSVHWMSASTAVESVDASEILMLPPTYLTCLEIAQYPGPEDVLAAAAQRQVDMFTPEVEGRGAEATLSMPESLRPLVEERLGR